MTHGDVAHMIECTANIKAARAVIDKFTYNRTESEKKYYLISLFNERQEDYTSMSNEEAVDSILSKHLCA